MSGPEPDGLGFETRAVHGGGGPDPSTGTTYSSLPTSVASALDRNAILDPSREKTGELERGSWPLTVRFSLPSIRASAICVPSWNAMGICAEGPIDSGM